MLCKKHFDGGQVLCFGSRDSEFIQGPVIQTTTPIIQLLSLLCQEIAHMSICWRTSCLNLGHIEISLDLWLKLQISEPKVATALNHEKHHSMCGSDKQSHLVCE